MEAVRRREGACEVAWRKLKASIRKWRESGVSEGNRKEVEGIRSKWRHRGGEREVEVEVVKAVKQTKSKRQRPVPKNRL